MNNTDIKRSENILILGAGELGMAMLQGFVKERLTHPATRLTVLLRPLSSDEALQPGQKKRLQQLAEWNIGTVSADFNQQTIDELAQVFEPFDAVVNCSGFVGGAGTQLKISRAVLKAGVRRYFPWQFGVDYDRIGRGSGQPVWDEQLDVRELLRTRQQTKWTIVSTGMFTSFLFEPRYGLVNIPERRVHGLGDERYALTLTTPADIGTLTAKIFFQQPEIENEAIYVAGDTVTWRGLTDLLSDHFGAPFTLDVASVSELHAEVKKRPEDVAAAYRLAFARPDGIAWDKAGAWNARHGIPVTDVREWLRKNHPAQR